MLYENQQKEIRANTSLVNLQKLRTYYSLDDFWKNNINFSRNDQDEIIRKNNLSDLAQLTIPLWKKADKVEQARNLANKFPSVPMVMTLASVGMEKDAIKMAYYLPPYKRGAASLFLSKILHNKKISNQAKEIATEELNDEYFGMDWSSRYGNIKTQTALKVALEKKKPTSEQDNNLIAKKIRLGCQQYCNPDKIVANVGHQEAGYLYYSLSQLDGTKTSIQQAKKIKEPATTIHYNIKKIKEPIVRALAYLGIIKAAAEKGEKYPSISFSKEEIRIISLYGGAEIIEAYILENISSFASNSNYELYLDNIFELSSACERRTECQDLKKLYWKTISAQLLNQMDSEGRKQLADNWLKESELYLQTLKIEELHQANFFDFISETSLEIENILIVMGKKKNNSIRKFIEQAKLVLKENFFTNSYYYNLAQIAIADGEPEIAFELTQNISDEILRYQAQTYLHLHEQSKISSKKLRAVSLSDLEKISSNDVVAIDAAGYYSKVDLDSVLNNQKLDAEFKLCFLIGRSRFEAKNNKAKKIIHKGIEWLKLHPEMEPSIDILVDLLLSTHDYQTVSWFLFELMDHKRNTNYLIDVPNTNYLETAVRNLIKIGNNKGLSIAAHLFTNEQIILLKPQMNRELFTLLTANNYWPGVNQEYIKAKIQGNGNKEQLLIDSLRYLLRRYNLAPSTEIIENLDIFNSKSFEDVKEKLDSLYESSLRFNIELNPIERCRQLVFEGKDSQLAYYVFNSGKDTMAHVAHYSFEVFQKIIVIAANVQVDNHKLTQFYQYLFRSGKTISEAQTIMDNFVLGLYPFGEDNRVRQLTGKLNWNDDKILFEKELGKLLRELLPDNLIKKFLNGKELTYSSLKEKFTSKNQKWEDVFWKKIETLLDTNIIKRELEYDINSVFEQLKHIENQMKKPVLTAGRYMIEVVEKGRDFFKFVGAINAVPSCVNTDDHNVQNHVQYMPWRLTEPTALTLAITDLQSGQVTGNLEMRFGINNDQVELFIVGLYSSGKSLTLIDSIMEFVEQSVALPLNISAINIASKHGGKIPKPTGYINISKLEAKGFSSVLDQDGKPFLTRGDDIIDGYNYQQASSVDNGENFSFAGYRKELK